MRKGFAFLFQSKLISSFKLQFVSTLSKIILAYCRSYAFLAWIYFENFVFVDMKIRDWMHFENPFNSMIRYFLLLANIWLTRKFWTPLNRPEPEIRFFFGWEKMPEIISLLIEGDKVMSFRIILFLLEKTMNLCSVSLFGRFIKLFHLIIIEVQTITTTKLNKKTRLSYL